MGAIFSIENELTEEEFVFRGLAFCWKLGKPYSLQGEKQQVSWVQKKIALPKAFRLRVQTEQPLKAGVLHP